MDPKRLAEFGLTEAEARVYLALLQTGRAKTGAIIKVTGLQSSTVYGALPSLMQKGLVSFVHMGKMRWYSAEPPESFQFFMEEKKRRLEEVLPLLKKMEAGGKQEQKSARVFESLKGFRSAFNDVYVTMKPGEEYYFFQVDTEQLKKKRIHMFFRNWHLRRSGKGIKVKGLAVKEAREAMKGIYELPHTNVRFVDEFLPTGMVVYKDRTLLLDLADPPSAFCIQSGSIADSFRRFFEAKWKTAKE
ncbi:MAG: helix-turn-helix domain-containing protein [Candidatus Micrarchaeota archaeon]|nr:helix-turn-helix domain-containing protein [Candidatus Micrarchaeota archaeon]